MKYSVLLLSIVLNMNDVSTGPAKFKTNTKKIIMAEARKAFEDRPRIVPDRNIQPKTNVNLTLLAGNPHIYFLINYPM